MIAAGLGSWCTARMEYTRDSLPRARQPRGVIGHFIWCPTISASTSSTISAGIHLHQIDAAAAERGLSITVVENAERILQRVAMPGLSEAVRRLHEAQGVNIRERIGVAAQVPEGDGYLAALINFRMVASALWWTDDAVKRISAAYS